MAADAQNMVSKAFELTVADKTMTLPVTTDSSTGVHVPHCASYVTREEERKNRWNLKDLGAKVTVDATSAATAAGLVSPIVMMVDKYAFRREPFVMLQSLREGSLLIHATGPSLKEFQAACPFLDH